VVCKNAHNKSTVSSAIAAVIKILPTFLRVLRLCCLLSAPCSRVQFYRVRPADEHNVCAHTPTTTKVFCVL
jgi:hypothetical protein